jgi:hypothetical protein
MSETGVIALITLALILPTATILPVVLHLLKAVKELTHRINTIEKLNQCPFNR